MFNHCDVTRMGITLAQSKDARTLLETVGDQVAFALRVRVHPFPEDTCAVWVFLAVRFKPYVANA